MGWSVDVGCHASGNSNGIQVGCNVKNILVVDDQPTIRQLLEVSLSAPNREILLAESGEQALDIARLRSPDLIIMDIMMPGGMDGFETVRQMRSDPSIGDCPVLILTAKDQQSERGRAVEMGVDGYLSKPFRLDELLGQVERLMA
jgi:DNA-binding response OmpR family regulator